MALVLLRFALGPIAIIEGFNCFTQGDNIESISLGTVLAVAGTLVSIGLFTPYAATAIAIGTMCRAVVSSSIPPSSMLHDPLSAGILIVLGTAVTLLGPGLFSLDFRLFGHREIVIQRRMRE